jgi:hypothetical protein
MVYDKKKSGDPDYDDKVPLADQGLTVVTAGDGRIVGRVDQALGPVTLDGAHLSVIDPEELDTRPEPGGTADYKADVQTYTAEDVPHETVAQADLDAPAETTSGLGALREKTGKTPAKKAAPAAKPAK